MKPKAMILTGLALVCGLGAAYMTSQLLQQPEKVEEAKSPILVAKRNLSVGERIMKPEDFFDVKLVTKENVPPDAITDFGVLKGKQLKMSRTRGDHITLANLLEGGGLDIPEGHQAVGLRVNLETTASGLATLPGSRVDLIWTVRGGDIQSASTRILLQNVLVLAADVRTEREGAQAAPAQVVTFALNSHDRKTVTLAKDLGVISLSLRKLNDDTIEKNTLLTGAALLVGDKEDPMKDGVAQVTPSPRTAPEPIGAPHSLLLINGERVQNVPYRRLKNGDIEIDD